MKQIILLIDSFGALLSALLLLVISRFETFFGLPGQVAYALLPVPLVFFAYSLLAFLFSREKWKLFLQIIAIANLLYCGLTLYIVIHHFSSLTVAGVSYFIAEMAVLLVLVAVEWRIAVKTP